MNNILFPSSFHTTYIHVLPTLLPFVSPQPVPFSPFLTPLFECGPFFAGAVITLASSSWGAYPPHTAAVVIWLMHRYDYITPPLRNPSVPPQCYNSKAQNNLEGLPEPGHFLLFQLQHLPRLLGPKAAAT